jgi:hypothetical protein
MASFQPSSLLYYVCLSDMQVEDALMSLLLAQHQLTHGAVEPLPPPPLKVILLLLCIIACPSSVHIIGCLPVAL